MLRHVSSALSAAPYLVCGFGILILLAGCGESTKEKMMKRMKARAEMKAAEAEAAAEAATNEEAATKKETSAAADEAVPADVAATPGPPELAAGKPQPAAPAQPAPRPEAAEAGDDPSAEQTAPASPATTAPPREKAGSEATAGPQTVADTEPAERMSDGSKKAWVAPTRRPVTDSEPAADAATVAAAAEAEARLRFHPAGQSLVWQGAEAEHAWQTWSLAGSETDPLAPARQFQADEFRPTRFAWDRSSDRLFVGGADGRFQRCFAAPLDPFDRHRRARIRRDEMLSGRQAHRGPITALAVASQGAVLATGDGEGMLRLWAAEPAEATSLPVGGSPVLACQPYGQEGLLLAVTEAGQAVSIRRQAEQPSVRPYAEFASQPTTMQVGRSGQGLVVGESAGKVTVWAPAEDGLRKAAVQAYPDPLVAATLLRDDATLLTASTAGAVTRWRLPLPAWRRLPIAQPRPPFLAVDRQGQRLAVPGRAGSVEIYEVGATELARRLTLAGAQRATAAVFSEDGSQLAVGDQQGRLHLFGLESTPAATPGPLQSQALDAGSLSALVASPNQPNAFFFGTTEGAIGKFVFAAGAGGAAPAGPAATAGDSAAGGAVDWMQQLDHPVGPLAWGRDAEELWCATPAGAMRRFAGDDGQERTALPPVGSRIRQIVPFGDKGHAVLVGDDSRLRVYGGDGQLAEDLPVSEPIRAVAASPAGDRLAAITRSNQWVSWDLLGEDASNPSVLPLAFSADDLAFAGETGIVFSPAADTELRIGSAASRRVELPVARGGLTDLVVLADETAMALADGSERVEIIDFQGASQGGWQVDGVAVERLAASPQTPRLAAVGFGPRPPQPKPAGGEAGPATVTGSGPQADSLPATAREDGPQGARQDASESQLLIGLASAPAPEQRLALPARCVALAFDPQGDRLAVALANQQVWLVDAVEGRWLETVRADQALRSIAFSTPGDELLIGFDDGTVQRQPLRTQGALLAHPGGIVELLAAGTSGLVSAGAEGEIKLWDLAGQASSRTPRILRAAAPQAVRELAVSGDGRRLAALLEGSPQTLPVWQLDRGVGSGALAAEQPARPWAVIEPIGNVTAASLSPAGEALAVGQEDGTIIVHALPGGEVLADWTGHRGVVLGLQWLPTGRRLLSGGTDQTVHVWELPTERPSADAIATGNAVRTVRLRPRERAAAEPAAPISMAGAPSETPSGEALIWQQLRGRVANHAVARDGTLFSEYPGEAAARQALQEQFAAWREAERATWEVDQVSIQQLAAFARARGRFFEQRQKLLPGPPAAANSAAAGASTPANLVFSTPANDPPSSESVPAETTTTATATAAPPQVAVSLAGFLYRLQPAEPPAGQVRRTAASRGRLQSWDFGYSGLELNDWTERAGTLRRLIPATDDRAVYTLPSFTRFGHRGEARPLTDIASFAAAPAGIYGKRAVWAMAPQREPATGGPPLGIFGGERWLALLQGLPDELPQAEVRVTALAFAHQHRRLAFCVGDANRQWLYLADPTDLRPEALQLLAEFDPDDDAAATFQRQPPGGRPNGLSALAFAPNDSLLVGHGRFENAEYRLHGWKLVWGANGQLQAPGADERAEEAFEAIVQQNTPVIEETSQPAIRFILPRREGSALGRLVTGRTRGIAAATAWMVAEVEEGIAVSDVRRQQQKRLVEFPEEGPRPLSAFSADGRWMLQTADGGQVRLHNLYTGAEAALTADDSRPHADDVTALAFSEIDPRLGFPAYAASVGRDGQVRVWDLIQPVVEHFLGNR